MNGKHLRAWNDKPKLRDWQLRAVRRFYALNKSNFLTVSTPGSGKTLFALRLAHNLLSDGAIERIVVVAPTEHLKTQWAAAAAAIGIDLDPAWANADGVEAADYHGVAVTYQQVSFAPDLYRFNCRRPTLVIFDEIHHAGDGLDWGIKLRTAFEAAALRLSLSGTPFRSDDSPIPFVAYKDGECQPDFVYSYGEALADEICRPVYFYTRKGRVAWVRGNGREVTSEMLDHLPKQEAAERLRAALDPSGNWLRDVLAEADAELLQKRREGHLDAAGLVIAIDQPHARRIAALLKKITGEAPAIAISQETEASRTIKEFARSGNPARWIVAVKMISEGVDIPRLRVGVYATTTQSALFFRQAVGRFVRVISELGEQSAVLFIPAVAKLMQHALAIKEEREHYLQTSAHLRRGKKHGGDFAQTEFDETPNQLANEKSRFGDVKHNAGNAADRSEAGLLPVTVSADDEAERDAGDYANDAGSGSNERNNGNLMNNHAANHGSSFSVIVPLYSEALPHDTIFNGMQFTPGELQQAADLGREFGIRLPAAQLAALVRHSFEKLAAPQSYETATVLTAGSSGNFNAARQNAATANNFTNPRISPADTPSVVKTLENELTADGSLITKTDRKRKLREQINRHANSLAKRVGVEERAVHRRWLEEMNGSRQSDATEEELWRKLRWLVEQNQQIRLETNDANNRNARSEQGGAYSKRKTEIESLNEKLRLFKIVDAKSNTIE